MLIDPLLHENALNFVFNARSTTQGITLPSMDLHCSYGLRHFISDSLLNKSLLVIIAGLYIHIFWRPQAFLFFIMVGECLGIFKFIPLK